MMLPPLVILALQIVFAVAALSVLGSTVSPWLRRLERPHALQALLWVHVGRFAPLALLAPGQADPSIPSGVLHTIAWGDFASAVLALVAIGALRAKGAGGVVWAWLFSIVSTADILVALGTGLGHRVYERPLGVGWYILALYVPVVCVGQWLIGVALLRPRSIPARVVAS